MPAHNNILVIRLSSLGDVLMSMPAVKALKERNGETRITWLVEGSVGELLSFQPFVDRVIQFPRSALTKALKGNNCAHGVGEARDFLNRLRHKDFDVIADFHGIIKSTILGMCVRSSRKVGFGKTIAKEKSHLFYDERIEVKDKRIHKVERNMLIARHLGADGAIPSVRLQTPDSARTYVNDFFAREGLAGPVFAVNPFSSKGSRYKRWGLDRYGELMRRLTGELGARTLVLWGPGEEKEAKGLVELGGTGAILSCPTNVPQLTALLQGVDMYIGGDTGVMHLAVFAGTPVVAIFGPTDQKVNGPYGQEHRIVRKEVACSPCKNRNCKDRECLTGISVDQVFEAVRETQNGAGRK